MPPELQSLLRVQHLDQQTAELQREIAALPKRIAQIEKTLEGHQRRLEADRAALAANQKERKRLDGDVQVQQQKISKLRDQMLSVKTNEQYRAFQHEIEFCEKEIRKAEDRTLDLMGESEPLEANVKSAEAALKLEQAQVASEKKAAQERTTQAQQTLQQVGAERQTVAATLPPAAVSLYERLRKKFGAHVIAEADDGRCSACMMMIRPQYLQDLKASERLMTCESCGRILYYHPRVNLESEMDLPRPAQA